MSTYQQRQQNNRLHKRLRGRTTTPTQVEHERRQGPNDGDTDPEDPKARFSSFLSAGRAAFTGGGLGANDDDDDDEDASTAVDTAIATPTPPGVTAAAAVEQNPSSQLSSCSQACFNTYFGADCQTIECICRSPIKLSNSEICINSSCTAMDQHDFLAGVGQYCGAAASVSLVQNAGARSTQTTSLSLDSTTLSSSLSSTSLASTASIPTSSVITVSSSTLAPTSSTLTSASLTTSSVLIRSSSPSLSSSITTSSSPSRITSLPASSSLPSPNNAFSASDDNGNSKGGEHVNTGAIVGAAFGILAALAMIGFCIYSTRRRLAGRTKSAQEFMRQSGIPASDGAAWTGGEKGGVMSEKDEDSGRAGIGAAGRGVISQNVALDGQFWENVKRQSIALYSTPPPLNPFGVRFAEQTQSYHYPQMDEASTIGGASMFSNSENGRGSLPLPGAVDDGQQYQPAGQAHTFLPPLVPVKERESTSSNSPTYPLRPLILPSLQPSSPPTSPMSPSAGQNRMRAVTLSQQPTYEDGMVNTRCRIETHSRRFSSRSGTGILGTNATGGGRNRADSSTSSLKQARSVPLPQSPPPPPAGGRKVSEIPEEAIDETEKAAGRPDQEGAGEMMRKESFEGLAYLLPEFAKK